MTLTKKKQTTKHKKTIKGGYSWRTHTTPIKKNRRIRGRGKKTRNNINKYLATFNTLLDKSAVHLVADVFVQYLLIYK